MNEEAIKQELQKYNVTDAAIEKLRTDYMALTVKGVDDTTGYEIVKKARIDIKKRRVEVEKTRVQLKAESLEYGRRVDGEAKRITALLAPIEDHLTTQEKIVDDEKARIKAEAEAKEAARIEARAERLFGFGASLIGGNYSAYGLVIPQSLVKACTDEQFAQFVAQVQAKKDAEDARLKAEEAARKAESERLARVAAEQEAERQRLAAEAKKQAEEAARIKAEQEAAQRKADEEKERVAKEQADREAKIKADQEAAERKIREEREALEAEKKRIADAEATRLKAIEDEKIRVENEKRHQAELEQARKEAAEKAEKEAKEKAEREAAEKLEAERKAKEAAEKKAARQPDKVKLLAYADAIEAIPLPCMKTAEGQSTLDAFRAEHGAALKLFRSNAGAL